MKKWTFGLAMTAILGLVMFQNCAPFESNILPGLSGLSQNSSLDPAAPDAPLAVSALDSSNFASPDMVIDLKINKVETLPIEIDFETIDGTAKAGVNYTTVKSKVTIAAGELGTTVKVPVSQPDLVDTKFKLRINSVSKGIVAKPEAEVTLKSTYFPPTILQDTWTQIATSGAPTPRFGQLALWTGSKLIVTTGDGGGAVGTLLTVGAFDPANNTWQVSPASGFALGSFFQSAVWSGTRALIFGGFFSQPGQPGTYLNTGGMYDPASNTWAAMTTAGAPSARGGHSAIWAGTRMIVFGGGIGTQFADGGIFDPATNTWSTMNLTGAPGARAFHTAVWTGTKMIVFGGHVGTATLNTGGIFDLASNTWSAMSTVGAPSGRSRHSAVWTGTKMIVFGGSNLSNQVSANGLVLPTLNTGGIYDPATNTWQPLSTVGAPSVRRNHSAFWTGTKMIVLGGDQGENVPGGFLGNGGMYDPATNTWQLIGGTGGPGGRLYPSATWTGKSILFFGGTRGGAIFNEVWNLK